jgi:hypothetical protein
MEMMTKIAGYESLKQSNAELAAKGKEHKSLKEIAYQTRTRVGTPDALAGGELKQWTNNIFLFSNIQLQGWRGWTESMEESPIRGAAFLAGHMAMKVPAILAAHGLWSAFLQRFGMPEDMADEQEDALNDTISYYKKKYHVIPLGGGKILTIPQSFTGGFAGGIAYELLEQAFSDKSFSPELFLEQLKDLVPYSVSGMQPALQIAYAWLELMTGNNPEDQYRNRPVIPQNVHGAGFAHEAPFMVPFMAEKMFGTGWANTAKAAKEWALGEREFDGDVFEDIRRAPAVGEMLRQLIRDTDPEAAKNEARRQTRAEKRKKTKQRKAGKETAEWGWEDYTGLD